MIAFKVIKAATVLIAILLGDSLWFAYDKFIAAIGALGALATFGAFLVLFKKDKDKQAQLNQLTRIAETLLLQLRHSEEKLRLKFKPDLWLNGSQIRPVDNSLSIDLNNQGELARLLKFEVIGDSIFLDEENLHLPYQLEKDARRFIFLKYKEGVAVQNLEYTVTVLFEDRIKNQYKLVLNYKGGSLRAKDLLEVGTDL